MSSPGGYPGPFAAPGEPGPVSYGQPPVPGSGPPIPQPPPGPGVTPPFTAPPTDRNRRGLWIGLGVGAFALVVCCVGGVFAFGLLAVRAQQEVETNAPAVVRTYLDALETRDYDKAYDQLCPALTRRMTAQEFATRQEEQPRPVSYEVQQAEIGSTVVVPASVSYTDGTTVQRRYLLTQQAGSTDLLICGGT